MLNKISGAISQWCADNLFTEAELWQIIAQQDNDKARYFAINEFNSCFIIRSPSFSYLDHSLTAQGSELLFFTQERGYNYE